MFTLLHIWTGLDTLFDLGYFDGTIAGYKAYQRIYGDEIDDTTMHVVFNKKTGKLEDAGRPVKQNPYLGLAHHVLVGATKDAALALVMACCFYLPKKCDAQNNQNKKTETVAHAYQNKTSNAASTYIMARTR